jgi:hypothetical protein
VSATTDHRPDDLTPGDPQPEPDIPVERPEEADDGGGVPPGPPRRRRGGADSGNSAEDNYGQLVQDAVIHGGLHFHGASAETFAFSRETTRIIREARRVDPHRVDVVRAAFVKPEGWDRFACDFAERGVGVVTGSPGTGRAATAIRVLSGLSESVEAESEVEEVTPENSDHEWGPERLPAEAGHAYLLDITGSGTVVSHVKARAYAQKVRAARGRLVIITETWEEDPADGFACLPMRAADAGEVFFSYLSHLARTDEAERWMADPRVRELLKGQLPGFAARLAVQAQRSRPATGAVTEADYAEWMSTVLRPFTNFAGEVRDWFASHEKRAAQAHVAFRRSDREHPERREDLRPTDYVRVLMEAAAVLEGCPSDVVLLQVDRLAEKWSVPVQFPSPISGGGATVMLKEITAYIDEDDRVRFKPGFGEVVLDHLWREYPKARGSLLTWSNRAVRDIPPEERRRVALRWFQLAERQRDPGPVNGLLTAWGVDKRLRGAVVPIIAQAAVHEELGAAVRRYLYQLAVYGPNSGELDPIVAQVCGQYGRVEPRTALVRLAWLADRARGAGSRAVDEAVAAIAEEVSARPALLRTLVEWADDEEARGRAEVARDHLARMLAEVDGRGVPVVVREAASPNVDVSEALLGDTLAAAMGAHGPDGHGRVLDAWFTALDLPSARAYTPLLERVLLRAAAAHTAANIRIDRRLRVWAHRAPHSAAAALGPRVAAADPFVRPLTTMEGGRA